MSRHVGQLSGPGRVLSNTRSHFSTLLRELPSRLLAAGAFSASRKKAQGRQGHVELARAFACKVAQLQLQKHS